MTTHIEMKEKSNFANIAENSALDSAEKSEANILAISVAAKKTPKLDEQLDGEFKRRWVPYGVSLRASLVPHSMGREELISELSKWDPVNAERIVDCAAKLSSKKYEEIGKDPKRRLELFEMIRKELDEDRVKRDQRGIAKLTDKNSD